MQIGNAIYPCSSQSVLRLDKGDKVVIRAVATRRFQARKELNGRLELFDKHVHLPAKDTRSHKMVSKQCQLIISCTQYPNHASLLTLWYCKSTNSLAQSASVHRPDAMADSNDVRLGLPHLPCPRNCSSRSDECCHGQKHTVPLGRDRFGDPIS